MIERLILLKTRKFSGAAELRDVLKSDNSLRQEIETLSKHFLGRSVSGCGNCYFDRYMELVNIKKMEESTFKIRAGTVLYDPVNQDADKILTANNCTDELALYHLKHNPGCRKHFYQLPDNLGELIENLGNPKLEEPLNEEDAEIIEKIKQQLSSGVALKAIKEELQREGYTVRKTAELIRLAKA
jgi:hypothetical protein